MEQNLNRGVYDKVSFLVGNEQIAENMTNLSALKPFSEEIIAFLDEVSGILLQSKDNRRYPDVVTFGFWLRRASVTKLKKRFEVNDGNVRTGRGVSFHIAPSNVPVNFAYSLAAGLITGNACIVRIPSKQFEQVDIICGAVNDALKKHGELSPYICLVRYPRDKAVNDLFSSIADVRVIWGGNETINELRKSPLAPRSDEICFADRFSFSIIDSDYYLEKADRKRTAEDFYNDTYLTDQNACTGPRLVVWTGTKKEEAKKEFWSALHELVSGKYAFQSIMGVNKLNDACLCAAAVPGAELIPHKDNLIVRMSVPEVSASLIDLSGNCGYFFEYDCDDLLLLRDLCSDKRCQTLSYLGDADDLRDLLGSGIKGVDRVVPLGRTMDFDLIWDGYDLFERLTRIISIL